MNTSLRALVTVLLFVAGSAHAATPAAHLEAECSSCHRLDRQVTATMADATRAATCGACHGPGLSAGHGNASFHSDVEQDCTRCHSFHETGRVRITTGATVAEFELASFGRADAAAAARDLVQCTPCHRIGGPSPTGLHPGHQAAALWYHANVATVASQSISESCLRCHDRGQALPAELPAGYDPPRPSRAAGHVTGVAVPERQGTGYGTRPPTDPRLQLVQGRIECTTCHDLYNPSNDMLAQFEPRDEMCLGCHVRSYDGSTAPGALALAR